MNLSVLPYQYSKYYDEKRIAYVVVFVHVLLSFAVDTNWEEDKSLLWGKFEVMTDEIVFSG